MNWMVNLIDKAFDKNEMYAIMQIMTKSSQHIILYLKISLIFVSK